MGRRAVLPRRHRFQRGGEVMLGYIVEVTAFDYNDDIEFDKEEE